MKPARKLSPATASEIYQAIDRFAFHNSNSLTIPVTLIGVGYYKLHCVAESVGAEMEKADPNVFEGKTVEEKFGMILAEYINEGAL